MSRVLMWVALSTLVLSGCRESEVPERPQGESFISQQAREEAAKLPSRDWVTPIVFAVPILVLAYAAIRLRKTIEAQNLIKLAEISIGADSPEEAADRIRLTAGLIGKLMPIQHETAVQKLVGERVNRAGLPAATAERRITLIRMLAEFPDRRTQILTDWETCFGDDDSWALHIGKERAAARLESDQ